MIFRLAITITILVCLFILLYKLLQDKKETKTKPNWFEPFNKPIFKIPIGVLIIIMTLVYSFRVVKAVPILMKLGLLGINFVIIYAVINYLFKNKKK
jgi:heme/copper-type cytochrome/quinol oxidase subunit 2